MNNELYVNVAAFIDYENDLLDAKQYDEWLTLWQDDGYTPWDVDKELPTPK